VFFFFFLVLNECFFFFRKVGGNKSLFIRSDPNFEIASEARRTRFFFKREMNVLFYSERLRATKACLYAVTTISKSQVKPAGPALFSNESS